MLILVCGCAQRETAIGLEAVPIVPNYRIDSLSGVATASAQWEPRISNGLGMSLQVGNANQFSSFFALRFDPNASLPDSVQIDSTTLLMHLNRRWPEGSAPDLRVLVKEITEPWGEDTLLSDSLPGRAAYPLLDTLLFTFSGDSIIRYDIPDTIWAKWIADDSTTFGLLFEPQTSGALYEVYSSEAPDSFRVKLHVVGTQYTLVDSSYVDTALVTDIIPSDDAFLATDAFETGSERLVVSQGKANRALLYFPTDTVFANFDRTVARAELHLWADASHPANLLYSGVNLLFKDGTMSDTAWIANPDSARLEFVATSSTTFGADNVHLVFDVSGAVAGFVQVPGSNSGFQVQATTESGHIARQIFHGITSEADSLRPRLYIWYFEPEN